MSSIPDRVSTQDSTRSTVKELRSWNRRTQGQLRDLVRARADLSDGIRDLLLRMDRYASIVADPLDSPASVTPQFESLSVANVDTRIRIPVPAFPFKLPDFGYMLLLCEEQYHAAVLRLRRFDQRIHQHQTVVNYLESGALDELDRAITKSFSFAKFNNLLSEIRRDLLSRVSAPMPRVSGFEFGPHTRSVLSVVKEKRRQHDARMQQLINMEKNASDVMSLSSSLAAATTSSPSSSNSSLATTVGGGPPSKMSNLTFSAAAENAAAEEASSAVPAIPSIAIAAD